MAILLTADFLKDQQAHRRHASMVPPDLQVLWEETDTRQWLLKINFEIQASKGAYISKKEVHFAMNDPKLLDRPS